MALAVNTPAHLQVTRSFLLCEASLFVLFTHLQGLGLLPSTSQQTVLVGGKDVPKDDIAYLFHVALQKLAFLPFSYVMDSWR